LILKTAQYYLMFTSPISRNWCWFHGIHWRPPSNGLMQMRKNWWKER
jgi:hypothetical protein